jgi:hypothetical protein
MRYLIHFTSFLIFLPTLIGLYLFKKLIKEFQVLTIYLFLFGLVELSNYILGQQQIKTIFILHLFIPVEFMFLAYIFQLNFDNWLSKKIVILIIFFFTLLSILNSIFLQSIDSFPSYTRYLESILLILLSLTYFYQVFTELKVEKLWEEGMFWFSTGLLIYYSGTMILYLSSNYLMKTVDMKLFAFFFNLVQSVCHFLMYSLFTVAIWKGQKK